MRYSLRKRDFIRGLLMAVGVPALLIIQQSIAAGQLTFNWQQIWMAAVGGGVAYLIKNFMTDDVQAAKNTLTEAKKEGVVAAQDVKFTQPAAPNDSELKH